MKQRNNDLENDFDFKPEICVISAPIRTCIYIAAKSQQPLQKLKELVPENYDKLLGITCMIAPKDFQNNNYGSALLTLSLECERYAIFKSVYSKLLSLGHLELVGDVLDNVMEKVVKVANSTKTKYDPKNGNLCTYFSREISNMVYYTLFSRNKPTMSNHLFKDRGKMTKVISHLFGKEYKDRELTVKVVSAPTHGFIDNCEDQRTFESFVPLYMEFELEPEKETFQAAFAAGRSLNELKNDYLDFLIKDVIKPLVFVSDEDLVIESPKGADGFAKNEDSPYLIFDVVTDLLASGAVHPYEALLYFKYITCDYFIRLEEKDKRDIIEDIEAQFTGLLSDFVVPDKYAFGFTYSNSDLDRLKKSHQAKQTHNLYALAHEKYLSFVKANPYVLDDYTLDQFKRRFTPEKIGEYVKKYREKREANTEETLKILRKKTKKSANIK